MRTLFAAVLVLAAAVAASGIECAEPVGGADRTGTIAFMIEALLGVDTNTLALDYLATGFIAGVTDAKHEGWFDAMKKTLNDLPGDTNAEKMSGVFLRMGFSQKEIDDFREFMLEPQSADSFKTTQNERK